jgi:2-polyprenyl-3-methyl-5-hydroxy-6-metoxy-1,4-benzoquinol methylase
MPQFIYNTCPICSSKSFSDIGECSLGTVNIEKPEKMHAVKCKNCHTIFANPLPVWNKEDFAELYNASYIPALDTTSTVIRERIIPQRRFREIEKHLQTKNKEFLEFGAGIQAFMAQYLFQKQHWNIELQEPSQEFAIALRKSFPQAKVNDTDFLDMDSSKRYSLIYSDSVLEHVPNPIDYIQKCADMLEPGGVLYFISPNEHSFRNWASTLRKKAKGEGVNYLRPFNIPYHLVGFSRKSIKIAAVKTGLALVKHTRRNDYEAVNFIKQQSGLLKYPVAFFLYLADCLGFGTNQEIILRKNK